MKTEDHLQGFHAVRFMREERAKISDEIADKSTTEILKYFHENRPKERIVPGA
jgi:hypothetical protein